MKKNISKYILYSILIVLFTTNLSAFFAQVPPRQIMTDNPSAPAMKKAKIKYEFHEGIAYLKSDLIIKGKFRFVESKTDIPKYEFIETGKDVKKSVDVSMIKNLVLSGVENKIVASADDSTRFEWIDEHRDLYREVRGGKIKIYDNSRIIDEGYEYLTDYLILAGNDTSGFYIIENLNDLEPLMANRPYFFESVMATGRKNTTDIRVALFLIALYNDDNPMRVLKWPNAIIETSNKKKYKGQAYVQPIDLRDEYVNSGVAYIHFYDGKEFRLFRHHEVKSLTLDGIKYKEGLYRISDKMFFGKPFQYQNEEYLLVTRIINNNNYFFINRETGPQDLVILKEIAGTYIRPKNEPDILKYYMESYEKENTDKAENE